MSELSKHIQRLETWLMPDAATRAWETVLLGEESKLYRNGELVLMKSLLHPVPEYESHFFDVMNAGYAWVNLSALGMLGNALVVCVEKPKSSSGVNIERVSVNLSGSFEHELSALC